MTRVLLDTHSWSWAMNGDPRLSARARREIAEAEQTFVSPISIYEIGQKVRLGKWDAMAPYVDDLPELVREQENQLAPLTPEIALKAALLDWPHRDPFDRMLAATCIVMGLRIVSKDSCFDSLTVDAGAVARIW